MALCPQSWAPAISWTLGSRRVSRTPVLSDGTTTFEQVTDYRPPSWFAYEVSGFTNVLGRFVTGARGTWAFAPATNGGTAITWTYAFRLRRFRGAAVRLLIAPVWRLYMRRALDVTVREVQRSRQTTTQSRSAKPGHGPLTAPLH
jgi:hypothetical protein